MHRSVLAYGGGKKNCSSFDGSCDGQVCMSTTDLAFYVVDPHMWGFHDACLEHHLQKGQGVAGRAFLSHNASFCQDVTQFCKTDYPLVHYARMFGLTGSFAICLRSSHTGDDDYILEFFLPPKVTGICEQKNLLGSILATMKQHFQSIRVASGMDLEGEEGFVEIIETSISGRLDLRLECINIPQSPKSSPKLNVVPKESQIHEVGPLNGGLMVDNLDVIDNGGNAMNNGPISPPENKAAKKPSERKRGKTEKCISLEVLQQYFAGSLKDAAKSLGVCPTTMKRICRQHGISRWPSRKINKVNRSLTKLKRVIESVQGAEGAFGLNPLTSSPLPVAAASLSWPSNLDGRNQSKSPEPHSEKHGSPLFQEDRRLGQRSCSREESAGTPTSHGSCQGSPPNESHEGSHHRTTVSSPQLFFQIPGPREPFGEILIEDAGSSKDLQNLCPLVADVALEDRIPESQLAIAAFEHPMPSPMGKQERKGVTIKATYKEDIIRFRISLTSGIVELKEEVAKRLKLEAGTFDIKYLDDDQEWVLIACDADLQECIDITRSSGGSIIRLAVHDVNANLGSSCESTGEL